MRFFDLTAQEKNALRRFIVWHLGYLLLVALFAFVIYEFGWFKSHKLLKESGLFNYVAPTATAVFVLLSPWRNQWIAALVNMYKALEGDVVFCFMAALVFGVGFYLYSGLIWLLGSLGPSMFYIAATL